MYLFGSDVFEHDLVLERDDDENFVYEAIYITRQDGTPLRLHHEVIR